jgi:hypothetical protein
MVANQKQTPITGQANRSNSTTNAAETPFFCGGIFYAAPPDSAGNGHCFPAAGHGTFTP